ncbi:MAG: bifunctional folylpolyglutamate synthase/dihydrofolate synthase, partial [Gammaproteobacteria bacterium]|nr:bifunctional folylpolyglutamate synthase/dihydrofolate synthase [Gammaproteobacteria bacterium]
MSINNLASIHHTRQQNNRTLKEWLDWQESLHFTAIELGLDRCRRVADAMHLLPPSYFVISIAGTNGKGSCAVLLELILREAGYKTGLYSSPHLTRYNERIKINGEEQPDEHLCDSFSRINQSRGEISLTYFEFGTLAAMDIFARNQIDIAIMEVGMGGRLDAVNMLDANTALISTIDIDHEQWLGSTREEIGREKAGIFRSMRPAICGDLNPPSTINEVAELVGASLFQVGNDFQFDISDNSWSWRSGKSRYSNLPVPGNVEFQVQNAATVLMALESMAEQFPVSQEAILTGLKKFAIPGRFQVINGDTTVVLDVAH